MEQHAGDTQLTDTALDRFARRSAAKDSLRDVRSLPDEPVVSVKTE